VAKTPEQEAPKTTAVATWDEELAKHAKAIAETERPSLSSFSLRGGILKLQDVALPDNMVEGVIIANVFVNELYEGKWDPNVVRNPICSAIAEVEEELAPNPANCLKLQNPTCSGCPQMEWGSDPGGGRGKACKEVRRLGIIPMKSLDQANPVESVAKAELAVLRVSVTSVKQWANYVQEINSLYKAPPWALITRIKVVQDAKTQFKIMFTGIGKLSPELGKAIYARREEATRILSTPFEIATPIEDEPVPTRSKKF
jgi:hypothetical protein